MGNIGGWLCHERRRTGPRLPQPADPHRRVPDLRRPGRSRPRGAGAGTARSRRPRLSEIPNPLNRVLGDALQRAGLPVSTPIGGHAVYVDARALLPQIPPLEYPGQALAVALYQAGGVRSCEIGTVMVGREPDGTEAPAAMDLVRLAIRRRTYTKSHIDYVIEVCEHVARSAGELTGYRLIDEPPALRHFRAIVKCCG